MITIPPSATNPPLAGSFVPGPDGGPSPKNGANQLNAYVCDNDPFKQIQAERRISIQVNVVVPVTPETWQVDSLELPEVYWDPTTLMSHWPLRVPTHGTTAGFVQSESDLTLPAFHRRSR